MTSAAFITVVNIKECKYIRFTNYMNLNLNIYNAKGTIKANMESIKRP